MWIYQNKNWPKFFWDDKQLLNKLANTRYIQGNFLGKMAHIGFEIKAEASLNILTEDIVYSSNIEGERPDPSEVRSSVARRLGIPIAGLISSSRQIDGFVQIMLDATQNYNSSFTKKRLFDWHAALFPTSRSGMNKIIVGDWRNDDSGPMRVVSGLFGEEKVHFEAPHANLIDNEMTKFFKWCEEDHSIDPILKAGLAHFWFVTVHPFEDGNGRIARIISDMLLTRADGTPNRFYSMSKQIELERQDYYNLLEKQQNGSLDMTSWLNWFLDCVNHAILNAEKTLEKTLSKSKIWVKVNQFSINERQRSIIQRMLEDDFKGHINSSKYAKLAKCSPDTALRDIKKLEQNKILIKNSSGGRSTSYRIVLIDE